MKYRMLNNVSEFLVTVDLRTKWLGQNNIIDIIGGEKLAINGVTVV
jgi:hypothetical protein